MNILTKTESLRNCLKRCHSTVCCQLRKEFRAEDTYIDRQIMKMISRIGSNQNMKEAALLISDKTVFRYRRIPKDKGGYCVLIIFQYNKKIYLLTLCQMYWPRVSELQQYSKHFHKDCYPWIVSKAQWARCTQIETSVTPKKSEGNICVYIY